MFRYRTLVINAFGAAIMCADATTVHAQKLPHGAHDFTVYADAESGMAPWTALIEVRDTVISGKPATAAAYRTRLGANGYLYNYTAAWDPDNPRLLAATWVASGRGAGRCDATLEGDKVSAKGDIGTASVPVPGKAAPEFAVASIVASRPLSAGDTVRYRVFRCATGPDSPSMLMYWDLNAVVKSESAARGEGGTKEEVWYVEGDSNYPLAMWIAKSDRQVLKAVIPQGTAGTMTEVYAVPGVSK